MKNTPWLNARCILATSWQCFHPVSGGSDKTPAAALQAETSTSDFFELTSDPIDVGAVARRVVLPQCGATVTLDGYAREWTKDRRTLYLVYEAYAPMALSEMRRLGRQAHERYEIAHIGIVHRTGQLEIGETSVVIAVSAPHRGAAFQACEWAIRELKRTVPIWKKEFFEDGEVWVEVRGRSLITRPDNQASFSSKLACRRFFSLPRQPLPQPAKRWSPFAFVGLDQSTPCALRPVLRMLSASRRISFACCVMIMISDSASTGNTATTFPVFSVVFMLMTPLPPRDCRR